MRLLPIGGGHIVNSSSGAFGVPLLRFAWTSAIGTVPGSLAIAGLWRIRRTEPGRVLLLVSVSLVLITTSVGGASLYAFATPVPRGSA